MLNSRFLRFCIVGGISAVSSLGMLYLLTAVVHLHYLLAFVIVFVVINALSYVASRRFTFNTTTVGGRDGLVRFFAVVTFVLALNTLAMRLLVGGLGLWPVPAAALLSVLNAPLTYVLHRRVSFGISREGRS